MQKEECTPLPTDDFARLLTEKLEKVKREQESHEKFSKKLMEVNFIFLSFNVAIHCY